MNGPRAAVGHMPFQGHRTQAQIIAQEGRYAQLPWCPPEYRETYKLIRRTGYSAAEARPMIETLIEYDRSRR